MERLQQIFGEAVHMKEATMKGKRQHFDSLPDYIKSGLSFSFKYKSVRQQHFALQFHVSKVLLQKGKEIHSKRSMQRRNHRKKEQGKMLQKTPFLNQQRRLLQQIEFNQSQNQTEQCQNWLKKQLQLYEQSLSVFRYMVADKRTDMIDEDLHYHYVKEVPLEYKQKYTEHLRLVYQSIWQCLVPLNKFQDAFHCCNQLSTLPSKERSLQHQSQELILKAKVYLQRAEVTTQHYDSDIREALRLLEEANMLQPSLQIDTMMNKVKVQRQKQLNSERELTRNMFRVNQISVSTQTQRKPVTIEMDFRKQTNIIADVQSQNNLLKETSMQSSQVTNDSLIQRKQALLQDCSTNEQVNKDKESKTKFRLSSFIEIEGEEWEEVFAVDFALRHGSKILALFRLHNYNEYCEQLLSLLKKCSVVPNSTNDFAAGKMFVNWIHEHRPVFVQHYINKYAQQKAWILQKKRSLIRIKQKSPQTIELETAVTKPKLNILKLGLCITLLLILLRLILRLFISNQ